MIIKKCRNTEWPISMIMFSIERSRKWHSKLKTRLTKNASMSIWYEICCLSRFHLLLSGFRVKTNCKFNAIWVTSQPIQHFQFVLCRHIFSEFWNPKYDQYWFHETISYCTIYYITISNHLLHARCNKMIKFMQANIWYEYLLNAAKL